MTRIHIKTVMTHLFLIHSKYYPTNFNFIAANNAGFSYYLHMKEKYFVPGLKKGAFSKWILRTIDFK